jgi:hypothetical protein
MPGRPNRGFEPAAETLVKGLKPNRAPEIIEN